MHSFVTDFLLGDLQFEVHFDQYYAPNAMRYFVFVKGRSGGSYYFNMEKHADEWKIINAPMVNELFLNNQKKFSDAIIEHHNNVR
jgi:hypothetical protein